MSLPATPPHRSHSCIPFPRDSSSPLAPTVWVGLCFSLSLGLALSPGLSACVSSCVSPPPVPLPTPGRPAAPALARSLSPSAHSPPPAWGPQPAWEGGLGGAAPALGPGAGLTRGLAHCRVPRRQLQPRRGGARQPRELTQPDPRQGAPQAPRGARQEPPGGGSAAQAAR